MLYGDVVDTEVLGAAQKQEVACFYQHGSLCRLISPAKKQYIIVQAKSFEVLHMHICMVLCVCLPLGLC